MLELSQQLLEIQVIKSYTLWGRNIKIRKKISSKGTEKEYLLQTAYFLNKINKY